MIAWTKNFVQELWEDKPRLYFTAAFLLSVGGTCFVLGGLAAMTAYCFDHQPLGLASAFKMYPVSGAPRRAGGVGGGWSCALCLAAAGSAGRASAPASGWECTPQPRQAALAVRRRQHPQAAPPT